MFNLETTTETLHPLMASPGPSESQKDDNALVAPDHRAYAAPDNLQVPPKNHEAEVPIPIFNLKTTTETLHPLMASPGPSESQKADSAMGQPEHHHCADAAPDNHEAYAATNPSPNPLTPPRLDLRQARFKRWHSRETGDYYDDIYMADSETDGMKRGLRGKGKGKAQQVEDEDEEMYSESNSSDGELSDISSEQKEDEDEEMVQNEEDDNVEAATVRKMLNNGIGDVEDNAQPSRIPPVPRPRTFSKPKGGAGPKLRAQPSRIPPSGKNIHVEFDNPESDTQTDSDYESDNPPQPLNTLPNPLNLSHDALTALTNTVLGVIGQRDDLFYSRMRRRKITSEKIKQPTIRASQTRRKKLGVRQSVNQKTPTADGCY